METPTKLSQVKTFSEFFRYLPYHFIEWICAVPVVLFLTSPLLYVIRNCISVWSYPVFVDDIDLIARVAAVCALVLYFGKRLNARQGVKSLIKENSAFAIFALFSILMILTVAYNAAVVSNEMAGGRNEDLFTYITYIFAYFFCASLIENNTLKYNILRIFTISGLLMGILCLIDLYCVEIPIFNHVYKNVSGVFSHFNHFGYYLTLVLLASAGMAVLDKNRTFRILGWLSFAVNTVVLIRDDTFGCYLAVAFGLLFAQIVHCIIHKRTNIAMWCVLGLYLGISLVMGFWYDTVFRNFLTLFFDLGKIVSNEDAGHAGSSRWAIWGKTLELISQRPLTGWGIDTQSEVLRPTGCDRSHNEYLQQMLFFGIPAGLLYIWAVLEVYLHGLRSKRKLDVPTIVALIAAFGYLVSAFFGNTTYYVSPLFFCLLGLGYRVKGISPETLASTDVPCDPEKAEPFTA